MGRLGVHSLEKEDEKEESGTRTSDRFPVHVQGGFPNANNPNLISSLTNGAR